MSPLPTCMARLRRADTAQAAAASRRPWLGPGLPQERPVSGRAEGPCPVLLAARARPGGGGSAWGSAARLDQHPNRSLESLTPGFLENFLELELGSHTQRFHGSHRVKSRHDPGPQRPAQPQRWTAPRKPKAPVHSLGLCTCRSPRPVPCGDLPVVPSPRTLLELYSLPGRWRERRPHVLPLVPTP